MQGHWANSKGRRCGVQRKGEGKKKEGTWKKGLKGGGEISVGLSEQIQVGEMASWGENEVGNKRLNG